MKALIYNYCKLCEDTQIYYYICSAWRVMDWTRSEDKLPPPIGDEGPSIFIRKNPPLRPWPTALPARSATHTSLKRRPFMSSSQELLSFGQWVHHPGQLPCATYNYMVYDPKGQGMGSWKRVIELWVLLSIEYYL